MALQWIRSRAYSIAICFVICTTAPLEAAYAAGSDVNIFVFTQKSPKKEEKNHQALRDGRRVCVWLLTCPHPDQSGDTRHIDDPAAIPTRMRFLLQHLPDGKLRAKEDGTGVHGHHLIETVVVGLVQAAWDGGDAGVVDQSTHTHTKTQLRSTKAFPPNFSIQRDPCPITFSPRERKSGIAKKKKRVGMG